MEVFKLEKMDLWGNAENTRYFRDGMRAQEEFDKIIKEWRADETLASEEDAEDCLEQQEPIVISDDSMFEDRIKEAGGLFWREMNTQEGGESDIYFEQLVLSQIEVE